jgi:hypothetical protein
MCQVKISANRSRFGHDRTAGMTKRPYIVVNPTERSTMQRYIVNNPVGGSTMQRYIVDNPVGGLTMQRYIVNNPVGGSTMQRYIVNNPPGGMTMQRYIVDNPTGGLTMEGRFVMDSIVETIKQQGFSTISIIGRSKHNNLKTNSHLYVPIPYLSAGVSHEEHEGPRRKKD